MYGINRLRETFEVRESVRTSMRGNRSKETKPEILLRHALWRAGLRGYRKNVRRLPGTPDIVFGKRRLAIFVHGCFWHQCPRCHRNRAPKTNAAYWTAKFEQNAARDERNSAALESEGFSVLVVWECELKSEIDRVVERIRTLLSDE